MVEKNKNLVPEKYILKKDDGLYNIPAAVVEGMSIKDIIIIGTLTYIEQQEQLMDDALTNDSYIEDVKIVDALEISLSKLEKMCPNLRKIIKSHISINQPKC